MSADNSQPLVYARSVGKSFGDFKALTDVDISVKAKEVVCIIGPSGSGKTTFLRCLNQLETYDRGSIWLDGELVGYRKVGDVLHRLPEKEIARQRRKTGMVFQRFNLFPHFTALQNIIEGPCYVLKQNVEEATALAMKLLDSVGLREKASSYPAELSGGQQQRVAIARALMQDPKIILADEPIASLDPMNAQIVMDTLKKINVEDGRMVIANLHTLDTARRYCDRVIGMRDGEVVFDGTADELTTSVAREIYGADDSFNEAATSTSIPADAKADDPAWSQPAYAAAMVS